ncbi:MAG TPA: peptide ABC transporter substrate-binding protein [Lachnospiraceae bacterium]|nr:peptide ABC transporter substrate-binding protein [Lachnospiraceae bacterium]
MAEQEKEALMKADHVKVYFKGKNKKSGTVKAVDDISFEIFKGETFGVVGESGCGKSTLGRTLIRLLDATEGHVYFHGRDIASLKGKDLREMRKKAQIIFQDPSACLNPKRNIKQILMEPFEIHNLKRNIDTDARIHELIQLVGLDDYHLSRYPHELSGGQKQRVGIARALALEPEIIICDEAVSALDVSVQAQVLNLLQELKNKLGLTYFFISHNLNVVYQVSDRVGVMYLGNMVEIACYNKLYEKRYHPYTEALLSAIPQVDQETQTERIRLEGEVPSPSNPPSGCRFHTRCPKTCDRCRTDRPVLKEISEGHFVACHLYDGKNQEIPPDTGDSI